MLSPTMSNFFKLVSGNESQIVQMHYGLGDTLKCVFRTFHLGARVSFFVIFVLKYATFRLL